MIVLPFPPSELSAAPNGRWQKKGRLTKQHRQWAETATKAAKLSAPASGDIRVDVRFVPPNNRSDRANFPVRMKPYFDGIADALGVNDRRFVPFFTYAPAEKPGRVEITITPQGNAA